MHLQDEEHVAVKNIQQNEIIQEIKRKTKNAKMLIIFNDLQKCQRSTMQIFLDILENVQSFCSIRGRIEKYHQTVKRYDDNRRRRIHRHNNSTDNFCKDSHFLFI